MIVPRAPQLKRMIQYVGRPLLYLVIWDVAVVLMYHVPRWEWIGFKAIPLALYGSAIGIIVGFRNNSSYSRWWEARGLWGQVVNNSRTLARQICTNLRPHREGEAREVTELQHWLIYHQIAYVHALRQQLRGLDVLGEIRPFLTTQEIEALDGEKNIAIAIQTSMGRALREARERNWLSALEWQAIDQNLDDLMDAQGGNERIKNTPMPKQYDYFPMLFVRIYCLLLPMGMVEQLGWFTPLGSTMVGFMFLALDKIGRDLEDPFDNTIYDVPLTAITRTIEINLRQMLGEKDLPAAENPVRGVLW